MQYTFRIIKLKGDGVIDPYLLCNSLIKASKRLGSIVLESCDVKEILFDKTDSDKKVKGVATAQGNIKADYVINARGI